MANCRSCDAEIEWAKWAQSGKAVPLDVSRDLRGNQIETPSGNLALVNGTVHYYGADDQRVARERRASHFVTCPHAGQWRNSR